MDLSGNSIKKTVIRILIHTTKLTVMPYVKKETWNNLLSEDTMINNMNTQFGAFGDFPISGVVKINAPAGMYFANATCISDAKMVAMTTVGDVNYTTDSYLNKVITSGMWHPFMDKVISITLSQGELQAWVKPIV